MILLGKHHDVTPLASLDLFAQIQLARRCEYGNRGYSIHLFGKDLDVLTSLVVVELST